MNASRPVEARAAAPATRPEPRSGPGRGLDFQSFLRARAEALEESAHRPAQGGGRPPEDPSGAVAGMPVQRAPEAGIPEVFQAAGTPGGREGEPARAPTAPPLRALSPGESPAPLAGLPVSLELSGLGAGQAVSGRLSMRAGRVRCRLRADGAVQRSSLERARAALAEGLGRAGLALDAYEVGR